MRLASAVLAACAVLLLAARCALASDPGLERRILGWGSDPLRDKYEELFDAKYPAHGYDPFNRLFPFEDVRAFDRAFDQRVAGVSRSVRRTDKQVILTLNWPGSGGRAVDVDVRRGLVRLTPSQGEEAAGPYRFRAAMAHEVEVEVPAEAAGGTAKVSRAGDVFTIIFDRKPRTDAGNIWVSGAREPEPEIRGGPETSAPQP